VNIAREGKPIAEPIEVRLVDDDGNVVEWAYFLPRDALHKYAYRQGLWAAVTNNRLTFSRDLWTGEDGLDIQVPVMREPRQFRLPIQPLDPNEDRIPVPEETRLQLVDFWYPDLIVLRAATYYAMTDPIMQPRVQTLEAQTKDLMYQIIERDDRNTDSPYENHFFVPVQNGLRDGAVSPFHPHADERR
jgi:hypothetical protein